MKAVAYYSGLADSPVALLPTVEANSQRRCRRFFIVPLRQPEDNSPLLRVII